MATYNGKWTNTDTITVTGGYSTSGSTGYTIPAYGMTEPARMDSSIFKFGVSEGGAKMEIRNVYTRVKAGYLAQVMHGSEIVWESKKAYKSAEKASAVAKKKISSSIDKLFNK